MNLQFIALSLMALGVTACSQQENQTLNNTQKVQIEEAKELVNDKVEQAKELVNDKVES